MNGPAANAGAVAAALAHQHDHAPYTTHAPENPPDPIVILYGAIFLVVFCVLSVAYKIWESRE